MSVLFISGVYAKINQQEIMENAKGYAEFSANIFQEKLIKGFKENEIDLEVISAPFIGAYPFKYKKMFFNGFKEKQNDYTYVSFNNIWAYRNFSRASSVKKVIKKLVLKENKKFDLILVYSAHEPFLEAAVYAKKLLPDSKICLVVLDLPQYMNLDANRSKVYDILKKVDIKRINKNIKSVDSFVLLTEPMRHMLSVGRRPYMVVEGIIDRLPQTFSQSKQETENIKTVVYTGKMNIAFGIKELVDSFMKIEGKNYRLVLCGDGDAKEYILEKAKEDKRIEYRGQVSPEKARRVIDNASVLVNPRPNDMEFTKYSFPSKNIEYLISGKPVVAYMLDGMPKEYSEFIYAIDDNGLTNALYNALNSDNSQKYYAFSVYASEHLTAKNIVQQMIEMSESQ